jgi:copper oxidase (laccase) domain-containing protein
VDLVGSLMVLLERLGIREAQVSSLATCTSCDSRFFSHRRDRGVTGRQLSFITCRGASGL